MIKLGHLLAILSAVSMAACSQSGPAADTDAVAKVEKTDALTTEKDNSATVDYLQAPSGTYALDKNHAYIVFTYSHHGYSTPFLRWKDWDSTLNWNQEDPAASTVNADIKTTNIDSGVDKFDGHLKEDRWFDAAAFPDITFKSTSLTKSSNTHGTMTGDLTVKGVTKPVVLNVEFNKAAFDTRSSSYKIGFSAKGKLNRSSFDLGGGVPSISDNVDIVIEAEYAMKKPQ